MPHFRIETNVPRSKIPEDFVLKAVPVLAKALGKPEQYCVVSVIPDVPMSFGGTTEPCAIANLMSIGALGVEQNKKHAKILFELVEQELGVKSDRMYITFQDEPTGNVGFKGTTFHAIFATPSMDFPDCESYPDLRRRGSPWMGGSTYMRMYITFQDNPTGNVGYKGTTFHALFG